jgi:hypothetical protein
MTVNQLVKLPFDVFCNASAGFFLYSRFGDNFHRYGLDVQLRRFFNNGNFYIGANGSYTGQASFKTGVLEYWDPDLFLGNVCAAYRYSPYNIWLKATVGKFLYSDNGVRFDVNRQFHELQFGFFLVKSADFGHTIGFNFKIPIIPQKYFDHRLLRIRPANTFDWEFRANTVLPRVVQYKTGNDIDDRLINFNPDYVKDQVSKMLKE